MLCFRREPGGTEPLLVHASYGPSPYPGSIYMKPSDTAAFVAGGPDLAEWISSFIRSPDRTGDLEKLSRSGAEERHLFVWVPSFTYAPASVQVHLLEAEPSVPQAAPDLPEPVTHCWIASGWDSPWGLRWSPDGGWETFAKGSQPPSAAHPTGSR